MVIQRWQSALLLIASILLGISIFSPVGEVFSIDGPFLFSAIDSILCLTIGVLCVLIPLLAIFMYKNLRQQVNIVLISVILSVAYLLTNYITVAMFSEYVAFKFGGLYIIIAIVLQLISISLIKSDDKKLKSYDRIR